jgi:hypothetical protein
MTHKARIRLSLKLLFFVSFFSSKNLYADLNCHYVHPVVQNGTEVSYELNQSAEQKDVRLITFHKDKKFYRSTTEDTEERIKVSCNGLFQNYIGPRAACFGIIQCENQQDPNLKACNPVSSIECPTANECMNDQNLTKTQFDSRDSNLNKPFGLGFLISQTNSNPNHGFLVLSSLTAKSRASLLFASQLKSSKIIPEFDIRFTPFPYVNTQETLKKKEMIFHKEVLSIDPMDPAQCISIRNPEMIGSYLPLTGGISQADESDHSNSAGPIQAGSAK